MIRYALRCADGHEFESWFRDSDAFDAQSAAKLLSCPACGSLKIEKQIMAPNVALQEEKPAPQPVEPVTAPPPTPTVVEPAAPAVEHPEAPASRWARLRRRLSGSNNALARALADLLSVDRIDADTWDDFDVRAGCERDDYHWPVPSNVGPGVSPAEHITDVLEQR